MNRWKSAAQLGYIHLTDFGLHRSIGFLHNDFVIVHPGRVLLVSVYLAWRISGVLQIVASVGLAWGATASPFALGLLPFSAACLVLLFMPAVLDRASDAGRLKIRARPRRGRYRQQVSSPDRYYVS